MPGDTSGKIFISYRRDDTQHVAGRLSDRLSEHFDVFMDVEAMEPGVDFGQAIDIEVGRCDVLLALIGREWASVDDHGRRRLDDPEDFVALEVRRALARGIRVIPVLVDGATMPQADELPADLKPLARRNAVFLDHVTFKSQADDLVDALQKILTATRTVNVGSTSPERLPGDALPTPAHGITEVAPRAVPGEVIVPNDAPEKTSARPPVVAESPDGGGGRRRTVALAAIGLLVLGLVGVLILLLPDSGSDGGAATTTTGVPQLRDRLEPGDRLDAGAFIATPDGRHRLEMTAGGSLVASTDGATWWSSTPAGPLGSWANMQDDGNLVVYRSAEGGAVWASETNRNPGAHLVIEDRGGEGRLTILAVDGTELWRQPEHDEPETTPQSTTTETTAATSTLPDTTVPVTTVPVTTVPVSVP